MHAQLVGKVLEQKPLALARSRGGQIDGLFLPGYEGGDLASLRRDRGLGLADPCNTDVGDGAQGAVWSEALHGRLLWNLEETASAQYY